MVRLLTWNVNGLRAILKRRFGSLAALLNHLQADIICFQETKLTRLELEREFALVDGWESFFVFCRTRTGYSGVATFCRAGIAVPVAAQEGITGVLCLEASSGGADAGALANCYGELHARFSQEELKDIDNEGRCVITDHGSFVLFNIYGPALSMEDNIEARFAYKLRFYEALQCRADALRAAGRRVIITGDLNISPAKIDLCDPAEQFEERRDRKWLHCWLTDGGGPFVDVFRQFHPNRKDAYTCWNTATGARVNNYGTRIDLILAADAQRAQHAQPPAAQTSQPSQPGTCDGARSVHMLHVHRQAGDSAFLAVFLSAPIS
ncbi:hypothetical protein WJX72_007901 [[Myrmecia] bisecta]|uniref:Endonuclease/exonuclease/phosphatase domain-containing protein n=1 Tax=[Myrmecia] bisecta TaxID=41462 RepID=A0AAW1R7Q9_9CHLO